MDTPPFIANLSHSDRLYLYSQVPLTRSRENYLLLFLCSCSLLPTVDAPLSEWAASFEGLAFSQQALKGFNEGETIHQTVLRVLALLSFENLLPPCSRETTEPVHGCYLHDFVSLLAGGTFHNRRALFRHMACSLRRTIGGNSYPGFGRLFAMIGPDDPLHPLDGLSDQYWVSKIGQALDCERAWSVALDKGLLHGKPNGNVGQSGYDLVDDGSFVIV